MKVMSRETMNLSFSVRLARPKAAFCWLYIGNLYYEVTADQLKRVFSRFGEIEDVKLVYDNRGLSRG